jgi:hypothetical protein
MFYGRFGVRRDKIEVEEIGEVFWGLNVGSFDLCWFLVKV